MILFFYIFAILLISSSIGVIISKNPIHSVLWLIFAFINSAGIFVLVGAEFIAMTLIILYVGAIAVLFLFVVMMLDIKATKVTRSFWSVIGLSISLLLALDLGLVICASFVKKSTLTFAELPIPTDLSNAHAIGAVLYTKFILPFQIVGMVLFLAMIGCIALTLQKQPKVKIQDLTKQIDRSQANSLKIVQIPPNQGLENIDEY